MSIWPRIDNEISNLLSVFTLSVQGTLDDVSKFTNVARPFVTIQLAFSIWRESREMVPPRLGGEPNRKMLCEQCDVSPSLAQGGHVHHVERKSIQ